MQVAVTGGSGQLGTLVLRRLCASPGITRVVSLDLRPPLVVHEKLEAVHADVRDPDLGRHLAGCEALVHLAFIVTKYASRARMDEVNVEGSKNVFRAALGAGVAWIVYSSSVAAYGVVRGHPSPIVEDTPRRFQDGFAYSANKFLVEAFLDEIEAERRDVAICRLRPAILAGDRMDHPLGAQVRAGRMPDPGGSPLPYVWDEDVADAVILAVEKGARGAFNLAADDLLPAGAIAEHAGLQRVAVPRRVLVALAHASPWLSRTGLVEAIDPAWVENDAGPFVISSEKAKRELGWSPRYPTTADVGGGVGDGAGPLDKRRGGLLRVASLAGARASPPPEVARAPARIHLVLTGRGGGDFAVLVDGGRARVEAGAPRPPTAVLTLSVSTFLGLLAGRVAIASAERSRDLAIEGDRDAAKALEWLVSLFRAQAAEPGARGWPARRMARWCGDGAV